MIKFSDFAVDVNGFSIRIGNIEVFIIRDKKEKEASIKILDLITNQNQTGKYCSYMDNYDEANSVLKYVSSEILISILSRIVEGGDWVDVKDESCFSLDAEYITKIMKICELEKTEDISKLLDWYQKVKQFDIVEISILESDNFNDLAEFLDELDNKIVDWLFIHQDQWYSETVKVKNVEYIEEHYEVRIKRKSDNFLLYAAIYSEEHDCKQFLDYVVGNIDVCSI